jgi:superfamily II DNA/RNA helicase
MVLFSATLDGAVGALTREYQTDPARHEVGAAEPDVTLADHRFWKVEPSDRVERTADIISAHGPTIVFCRTRHGVDRVVKVLGRTGVYAAAIHGGRSQGQRDRALREFTNGNVSALIATDVAARGIHVDDVACVVHFDLPADAKDYLHRSGRTARAGASGVVVSLVAKHQVRDAKRLQRAAGITVDVEHPPADAVGLERPVIATPAPRQSRPARQHNGSRPDRDSRRRDLQPKHKRTHRRRDG